MKKVFKIWFFVFIFWFLYRFFFRFPEAVDELVFKPLIFLGPLFWSLKKEKKSFASVGISKGNFFRDLYLGIGIGILFGAEALIVNYLKHGRFSFAPLLPLQGWGLLFYLFLSFATSFSEEVFARGFLFGRIYQASKKLFFSASLASILFLILHLPILLTTLSLAGPDLGVFLSSLFILGFANGIIFSITKTITAPIFVHAFWNMTVALYL